jgi:4-amino-4-deoxy-L-arabinose transferase-like glycosyltransferase
MKKWTRWQDWVALAAGVVMLLTPLWSRPDRAGMTAMIVLGVVLAATALWSLYDPGAIASEYSHAVIGVLMFLTPWVFGFTDLTVAAFTCWILGVVAVAVGLLAVPESQRAHRQVAH